MTKKTEKRSGEARMGRPPGPGKVHYSTYLATGVRDALRAASYELSVPMSDLLESVLRRELPKLSQLAREKIEANEPRHRA